MRWKRMTAVLAAGSAVVALAAGCSSSGNKGGGGNGTNNGTSSNGPDLSKQPKSKIKAVSMSGACQKEPPP